MIRGAGKESYLVDNEALFAIIAFGAHGLADLTAGLAAAIEANCAVAAHVITHVLHRSIWVGVAPAGIVQKEPIFALGFSCTHKTQL